MQSNRDESCIHVTGFTRDIVIHISKHVNQRLQLQSQCSLNVLDVTGLCLQYLNSVVPHKSLCQIYGITPAVCSRLLNRGLDALHTAVQHISEYQVYWPTFQQQQYYSHAITQHTPQLSNVFGFVDGIYFI